MDRFAALTAFVAVAEHQGFAKAARALNSSPPAMTRAIAALEAHLGTALFHRSTRTVVLTQEGSALLERAREILFQLREAEHVVMGQQAEPHGELHVTAPVMFGRLHVLPVVASLLADHPAMTARMMLLDRNVRIVEEGIDVAVRIGTPADSSLMSVSIGSVRQMIVASPDYCARRGVPDSVDDLARHDIVAGNMARGSNQWRLGAKADKAVTLGPRITVNSTDGMIAAAQAGLGLANVLSYQVADAIASGTLRTVLEAEAPPAIPVTLLFHRNRAGTPAVRRFIDAMRDRVRSASWG